MMKKSLALLCACLLTLAALPMALAEEAYAGFTTNAWGRRCPRPPATG